MSKDALSMDGRLRGALAAYMAANSCANATKNAAEKNPEALPDVRIIGLWLESACRLPGKSLHVGLALIQQVLLNGGITVRLSNKTAQKFSVDRNAKYRALSWLEDADLISTCRLVGQTPYVTLTFHSADSVSISPPNEA